MSETFSKKSSNRAAAAEKIERRARLRYQLTATAEVTELNTGARFFTRTNDLSEGGCFVDSLAALPAGSQIRVHLSKGEQIFEAIGKVIYSQQGLGMGIAFAEVDPKQRAVLHCWLAQVSGERSTGVETTETPSAIEKAFDPNRALAPRLIHLLVARGILTEEDAAMLLYENEPPL